MNSPVSTFGDLLRERAVRLQLVNAAGNGDAERLAGYLVSRGIKTSPRAVASYFNGERAPRIGKMELILDALDIYEADRTLAYKLAAKTRKEAAAAVTFEVDPTSSIA